MPPVAVIDIGSNSIKLLVAERSAAGPLVSRKSRTIETRISAGISQAGPRLSPEGMARGLAAIQSLLADAAPFTPATTVLVATSAVRDAVNGPDFRAQVLAQTGHEIRILSGDEEANLIGLGLTCDPALAHFKDFYLFDLGGGSLECLSFRDRQIEQAVSLQLGCVRLTEKFVSNPALPFAVASRVAIFRHARDVLIESGFTFSLSVPTAAVGTGGTIVTARAILAARGGRTFEQSSAVITTAGLIELLDWIGPLSLAERQAIPGMPAARADVFPTALATIIAVARFGGLGTFHNSFYNLRWGLASEAALA